LRLLSPFMPFITEELWQRLPSRISREESESICVVAYPEAKQYAFRDETLENQVAHAMHIVKAVRSLRSDYGLTAKMKTELYIAFENSSEVIEMEDLGIINVPKEIAKLTDREEKVIAQLQKLDETLSSPAYNKVPLGIRNNNVEKRALLLAESKHLKEAIIALKNSLA
uniref:valine--tRNA ligase n=1 Tax=Brugia timori TaxID=42155 RepID=A0A0R3Q8K8_9BILA